MSSHVEPALSIIPGVLRSFCDLLSAAAFFAPLFDVMPCLGTAFVGRERLVHGSVPPANSPPASETAPSHDDAWSTRRPVCSNLVHPGGFLERRGVNRASPTAAGPAPSCCKGSSGIRKEEEEEAQEVSSQDVLSPPRLQPFTFGPAAVGIAATTAALAPTAAVGGADRGRFIPSTMDNEQDQHPNRAKVGSAQIEEDSFGEDGHGTADRKTCQGQPAAPKSLFREGDGGFHDRGSGEAAGTPAGAGAGAGGTERIRPSEPDGIYSVPNRVSNGTVNDAAPPRSRTTGAQHHNQRGGGRVPPDSAVRDNWGSVFVVGGGRQRRRPPVMHFLFPFFPLMSDWMGTVHHRTSFFIHLQHLRQLTCWHVPLILRPPCATLVAYGMKLPPVAYGLLK